MVTLQEAIQEDTSWGKGTNNIYLHSADITKEEWYFTNIKKWDWGKQIPQDCFKLLKHLINSLTASVASGFCLQWELMQSIFIQMTAVDMGFYWLDWHWWKCDTRMNALIWQDSKVRGKLLCWLGERSQSPFYRVKMHLEACLYLLILVWKRCSST